MRVGLFGCTCDPIHFGHINLAIEIYEKQGLDAVWIFPTGVNPFKIDKLIASKKQRLAMAQIAAEEFPILSVRSDEIERPGVSYAIDTVRVLQEEYDYEFSLILGEDAARGLPRWKDLPELLERVKVYVGSRSGASLEPLSELNLIMTETRTLDISSTEIRSRIKNNLCCRHLMPGKVIDFIIDQKLYS